MRMYRFVRQRLKRTGIDDIPVTQERRRRRHPCQFLRTVCHKKNTDPFRSKRLHQCQQGSRLLFDKAAVGSSSNK